jgi:hypothetical protein
MVGSFFQFACPVNLRQLLSSYVKFCKAPSAVSFSASSALLGLRRAQSSRGSAVNARRECQLRRSARVGNCGKFWAMAHVHVGPPSHRSVKERRCHAHARAAKKVLIEPFYPLRRRCAFEAPKAQHCDPHPRPPLKNRENFFAAEHFTPQSVARREAQERSANAR